MEVTKRKDLWTFAIVMTLLQLAFATVLQLIYYPPELQALIFAREPILTMAISMPVCLFIGAKMHELWQAKQAAERRAGTDSLTSLPTRDAFYSAIRQEAEAYGVSLMIDIDHFKSVNDTHGHLTGDRAIRHVARILKSNCREVDLICRFGGEEFVIFLHNVTAAQGRDIAERMRICVASEPFPAEIGPLRVTISIGGSLKEMTQDIDVAIAAADAALYAAKEAGRNRVVLAGPDKALIATD